MTMDALGTIAITGASGLIGGALRHALRSDGARVLSITRSPRDDDDVAWDPRSGSLDATRLAGVDAIVHLAGENVASGRWTAARKRAIRESRTLGTDLIARTAAGLAPRPRVLISASAVGLYGDRGDEILTERSAAGTGFLADVCTSWERAADPARDAGIRVAHPRFGVVLAAGGGALAKMLPIFRLGLGGPLGDGRQWFSWISLRDTVRALRFLLAGAEHAGAFDVTAPRPVTNADFTRALGRTLHRPAFLPVPRVALRLLLGGMADEALLASQRALPERLVEGGFSFQDPTIEDALRHVLGGAV